MKKKQSTGFKAMKMIMNSKNRFPITSVLLIALILLSSSSKPQTVMLPVNISTRTNIDEIKLTEIGDFGLLRKARPDVPAHFHTGIDIKRPGKNYQNEPIFPLCEGNVISIRRDGPFAQIIIEHKSDFTFWTVYEHVAGISVKLFDNVRPDKPIARFMNKEELNRYGWQFDHFHLEILKKQPVKLKPDKKNPERLFASYTLVSFSQRDLESYFFEPLLFLRQNI